MQPLVSVVVPVFNGIPHLRPLVDSLLTQTYPNLDIVFSEGGGTDASLDFLKSLPDPRIRIIEQPRGTTAAGNWTAASRAARGEFTKLICQDDLLYPRAIEQQVQDLITQRDAVMAISSRDIVDAHGNVVFRNRGLSGLRGNSAPGQDVIRQCYLRGTNVIGEPLAVLFRTEALLAGLPWRDDNPLMLDLSLYERVAPTGLVALRREAAGAFRVSNASWSTRLAKEQLQQTRDWQDDYASTNNPTPSVVDRGRALLGRHVQTILRRMAYTLLSLRGRLDSS